MFKNFKLSYIKSIIVIIIIIILLVSLWDLIENFDNDINECNINNEYYDNIKIKTQQCDNCKLYGNMDNSFINIYKQSFL